MERLVFEVHFDVVHFFAGWHTVRHLSQLVGNLVQVVLGDVEGQLLKLYQKSL